MIFEINFSRGIYSIMADIELNKSVIELLEETIKNLNGNQRRIFMAKTVNTLGPGGQREAERKLGWSRGTIRKGQKELQTGTIKEDNFSARGRKKTEEKLPNLLEDIKSIVKPKTQTDPTFKTTKMYTPVTAKAVRKKLKEKGYKKKNLPSLRTINNKVNALGFRLRKINKDRPVQRIKETNAIFKEVFRVNEQSDKEEGVLRISIDAKATIKIGLFSRGGKSRLGLSAVDHDFQPKTKLKLWGIFLPVSNDLFFEFTESQITADFIVDSLERNWPKLKEKYNPHTLVINSDNGPENHSRRTQLIKRLVHFALAHNIKIRLAYYPPYHSKYNPVERVWGILEQHWNGELLDYVGKVLALARTFTYNGKRPSVQLIEAVYENGVKLTRKEMNFYETMIDRLPGLEKWAVQIDPKRVKILL